ncbi:TolC family protein [Mucilaginibacter sp. McL0603]|uniref:TolC family protein n=1 Tax=Mucilaginibacter sp. McL0603 TaxID=3415670 RepID=UPI003CE96D7E
MKWFFSIILCAFSYSVSLAQTYALDHYLEAAQNNSPLLKDLKNQISSARLDSMRLRAGLKPQVTGTSAGAFSPVINGFGYAGAITNVQTFSALAGVNQQIIGRNYRSSQLAAIALQQDSLVNASQLSVQDLKKAVIGQYITAYGSLQQLKFNVAVVDRLLQEDTIFIKLTRSNVYKQADYMTFLVTLKQQQIQLSQSRIQYKTDFATLNYLSGITDTSMVELSEPQITKTIYPDLQNSIFFKKFKLDSLRLSNSNSLIDYNYKPKANIFADAGYNTDFVQPAKNFGASFGFSVSMPIYDGGQRKLLHKKIQLEEETRQYYKYFYSRQYKQQIDQLNQQIDETEKLFSQINEQIKYSEALIKIDSHLLQTGDLKISDFILAINNYLTVKNLLTQTLVNRLQLINQLNYWNK